MILMDGAMGTALMSLGIPANSCFESLNLKRPSLIQGIHRRYVAAGAEILVTNTFGANRLRLGPRYAPKIESINRSAVRLARRTSKTAKVFASIGPLGPKAKGLDYRKMYSLFREQGRALTRENPDGFVIETMTSLLEAKAATTAIREVTDQPVFVLFVPIFPKKELRSLSKVLRSAGADVLGTNCGPGPQASFDFLKALAQRDKGPFCARPSAGLPGHFVSAKKFADWAARFKKLGCRWFGGCCGTTPEYIRLLKRPN